jgi:hypothetical protein
MQQQTMGMATLKEIEQRLKSVRNIEKITKVRWDHGLGGGRCRWLDAARGDGKWRGGQKSGDGGIDLGIWDAG